MFKLFNEIKPAATKAFKVGCTVAAGLAPVLVVVAASSWITKSK